MKLKAEASRSVKLSLLRRLREDPWGLVARAFRKTILGPLRYGRPDGYDAAKYWEDRFRQYGLSLRGPGHEGVSEERNAELYDEAVQTLLSFCRANGINLRTSKVLEIGCGTGVWAEVCRSQGTTNYTGLDITDVLLPTLQARFPTYRFLKGDVTAESLPGKHDVILMIDVVEHIVQEQALSRAMEHVRGALRPGGAFLVAFPQPENEEGSRDLFYLRFWAQSTIKACFPGFYATPPVPFRYGELLAFRAPESSSRDPTPS